MGALVCTPYRAEAEKALLLMRSLFAKALSGANPLITQKPKDKISISIMIFTYYNSESAIKDLEKLDLRYSFFDIGFIFR